MSLDKGGQADTRGAALRAASEARGPSEDEEPEAPAAGEPCIQAHIGFTGPFGYEASESPAAGEPLVQLVP